MPPQGPPSIAVRLPAVQQARTCWVLLVAMTCLPGGTRPACFPLLAPRHSSGQTWQWEMPNLASCLTPPSLRAASNLGSRSGVLQERGAAGAGCRLCSYLNFPMKFSPPRDRSVGSMEMR